MSGKHLRMADFDREAEPTEDGLIRAPENTRTRTDQALLALVRLLARLAAAEVIADADQTDVAEEAPSRKTQA